MKSDTTSRTGKAAISSTCWHVVHSCWDGAQSKPAQFQRSIVSEHDDRATAMTTARQLLARIAPDMVERPRFARDQVFVRKPHYKTLKRAPRVVRKTG